MSDTYPPFSGDDVPCAACGFAGAFTTYRATGDCAHPSSEVIQTMRLNPRLCRTCGRCGHQWDEATVTPDPEAKEQQP